MRRIRTQIYLTEEEQMALRTMARETGKTQSELIRMAIDRLIDRGATLDRLAKLRRAKGIWKGRQDLPQFDQLRREWDRAVGEKA